MPNWEQRSCRQAKALHVDEQLHWCHQALDARVANQVEGIVLVPRHFHRLYRESEGGRKLCTVNVKYQWSRLKRVAYQSV